MNFPADIWPKVLSLMEGDMTATTINTWFDDATPVALDANRFVLHLSLIHISEPTRH